jgi:hypothetical protein
LFLQLIFSDGSKKKRRRKKKGEGDSKGDRVESTQMGKSDVTGGQVGDG